MKVSGGLNIDFVEEVPIIINGYWHEWINGEWVNTGQKATGVDAIDINIDNANLVVTEANWVRNYSNTGFKIKLSQGGFGFDYYGGPIMVEHPRTWRCDVVDSANVTGFSVPIQFSEGVYEAIFPPITSLTGNSGFVTLRLDIRGADGVRQFVNKRIQYSMSGEKGSDAIDIHIDNANLVAIENNGIRNYSNTGFKIKLSQGGFGFKYYGYDLVITEARSWTCEILASHNINGFTPPGPFTMGVDTAVFPPITGITGTSGYVVLRFHIRDMKGTYQFVERRILYNVGGKGNKGDKGEEGDNGTNYLPMGYWQASANYYLSDLGTPFVKRADGSALGYSVFVLNVQQATTGLWVASEWRLVESVEFMYMQEAYIEQLQAEFITSKFLRTSTQGARTEINSSGIKIFNETGQMNIRIGNKNGYAVLEYYDNDGRFLYDLGPNGIMKMEVREEKWTTFKRISLGTDMSTILNYSNRNKYKQSWWETETTYYVYTSKISAGINQDPTNDGVIFTSPSKTSSKMALGYYCRKMTLGVNMTYRDPISNTNQIINSQLPYIHDENETVYDKNNICFIELERFTNGVKSSSIYHAYWNETPEGYPII